MCVCKYVFASVLCVTRRRVKDLSNYSNSVIMCSWAFPPLVNALLGDGVRVRIRKQRKIERRSKALLRQSWISLVHLDMLSVIIC